MLLAIGWGSFMALFFHRSSNTLRRSVARGWWFISCALAAVLIFPPLLLRTHDTFTNDSLPDFELSKLKIDGAKLDNVGYLNGVLYNGSSWTIRNLTIQVIVYNDAELGTLAKENIVPIDPSKPLKVIGPDGNTYTFVPGTTVEQAKHYFEKKGITKTFPLTREYAIEMFCQPQSSQDVIQNLGIVLEDHQRWKYQITRANGFKQ